MTRRKRLLLKREDPGKDRTFGSLFFGSNWVCETMEPGDADVDHPRVDPGLYVLDPHGWEPSSVLRFRQTWALVGRDVAHQRTDGIARSAVLFHAGNRDEDTLGCILVGLTRGMLEGEPALLRSREAMVKMRDLIGPNMAELVIMGG